MKAMINLGHEEVAYTFLRVTFGMNLFLHGLARLMGNQSMFEAYLSKQMQGSPLPEPMVHAVAVVLPWCEGAIGCLILIGLWTRVGLVGGSMLLLILQFGSCLAQKWDIASTQLIYVLLLFILLFFLDRNRCSVDSLMKGRRGAA